MNPWQQARQIRWLLLEDRWPEGAAGRVFPSNSVVIVSGADPALSDLRYPIAMIVDAGQESDQQTPELLLCRWRVMLFARAEGAEGSSAATIGTQRSNGLGASEGRGVMEIAERVVRTLSLKTGANGLRCAARVRSGAQGAEVGSKHVAGKEIEVESWATEAAHYDEPLFLAGTGGSGQVTLTWKNAPARWDQYDKNGTRLPPIIRYASGATAPTSATSGTGVSGISAGDTSKVVSGLSAGTYSFAIFQPYTESGSATPDHYSAQELSTTATSVTVT